MPRLIDRRRQQMAVLTSQETTEWYTPPWLIELIREALGGSIDLDPASNRRPQQWIRAAHYFTTGGLTRAWKARTVFCNPPYGIAESGSNQGRWSRKMEGEYSAGHFRAGVLLIHSRQGYRWYEYIWRKYACCCLSQRVSFIKPVPVDGKVGSAKAGQTVVYFGRDLARFERVFSPFGRVLFPEEVGRCLTTSGRATRITGYSRPAWA